MSKKLYMVSAIKETAVVSAMGIKKELSFSSLADGCVGVSLWFDTEENAKKYAPGAEIEIGVVERDLVDNTEGKRNE